MTLRQKWILSAIISIMMAGSLAAVEQTKFPARVGVERMQDGSAYVTASGRRFMHVQRSNGTLKPADRAAIVADRLSVMLQKLTDIRAISAKASGANGQVLVNGALLAIATPTDAKAASTTAMKLAETWVSNLRKVLTLPPIYVEPESMLIPLGEKRTLSVKVFIPGDISAEVADVSVVRAQPASSAGMLLVEGLTVGDSSIRVRCGQHEVNVPVKVRKYAAAINGGVKATVTGLNPPQSLALRSIRESVHSMISLEPGASIRKTEVPQSVSVPVPGRSTQVPVSLEAEGVDYLPVRLTGTVELQNRVMPKVESESIWFCNEPETVRRFQVLFTGKLVPSQESTRLLYHHFNDMQQCMGFVIDVVNPSDQPAELHIIEGVAEPMADVVVVGYVAGRDFLNSYQSLIGRILTLAPNSRRVLVSQAVHHPKTASGIMELRQLTGQPLVARVIAKPETQRLADDPLGVDLPLTGFDPAKVAYSDGVFPRPWKIVDAEYTVGKSWQFIRLGKNPIQHATLDRVLYGFGITYDIRLTIDNPTDRQQIVEVLFEAPAGPAAGIFLLDGTYSEIKRMHPPDERVIGSYTLQPGQTRRSTIRTIPLSGSAYPATLIVRVAK